MDWEGGESMDLDEKNPTSSDGQIESEVRKNSLEKEHEGRAVL